MEEMYGFHSTSGYTNISPDESYYNQLIPPAENNNNNNNLGYHWPLYGSDDLLSVAVTDSVTTEPAHKQIISYNILPKSRFNRQRHQAQINGDDDEADAIKEKIASHPSFSKLIDAYVDCQKLGAPPEIACLLDDIRRENDVRKRNTTASTSLGLDPELDEFMETFCLLLSKYKSDLSRPFDEAATFLGNIETQLRNLSIDEGGISSEEEEEEVSRGETDMNQEVKDMLLRKFGGRISSLKNEFTKKKKKGKLPKEARQTLLDWWNSHYKWPYPTEGDKISLAEITGLDPKQINNWFINQRKRHWKPSESMQLAIMGGLPVPHQYNIYSD